ncbi:MAG: hypothetical protein EZS28_036657, partial [Streblomastix strix]
MYEQQKIFGDIYALARHTLLPPLELRQLPNYQGINISSVQVDRLSYHSDPAITVRQNINKNNSVETREALGQTEQELDNEEDEEQERTLLEEIVHVRSNVEQTILSPVGAESRKKARMLNAQREHCFETPTEVVDEQKAQQDAANAEKVARLLDPSNIMRVNQHSKSSLSLQVVVYNPEDYKQSSGRDLSSSFVPPHQDVPTLGNLGRTQSSEVQITSSAEEELEPCHDFFGPNPLAGALRASKQAKSSYLFRRIKQLRELAEQRKRELELREKQKAEQEA